LPDFENTVKFAHLFASFFSIFLTFPLFSPFLKTFCRFLLNFLTFFSTPALILAQKQALCFQRKKRNIEHHSLSDVSRRGEKLY